MSENAKASSVNRAKLYQLVLFPLNNGATNVYYVLVLSYIATFGSNVLALGTLFASVMVTAMRLCDAITDPIIGALMDRTNGKFGKFRPFMAIGNLIMAVSILVLYGITPMIPDTMMWARYAAFVGLYFVWVIGYTFQTSCTRSGQTVLTNDPKQRPLFTIFNTVGSLLGMGVMQFLAPILAKNYEGGYSSAGFFRTLAPVGIVMSIALTILAIIGIWEKDQQVLRHRRRKDREGQGQRVSADHPGKQTHAASDDRGRWHEAGALHRQQHHGSVHALRLHDGCLRWAVPAMMVLATPAVCRSSFSLCAPARRRARRPA